MSMKSKPSFVIVGLSLAGLWVGSFGSIGTLGFWASNGAWAQAGTCVGDCDHDGTITVDELIAAVNVVLGTLPADRCPAFGAGGEVTIAELTLAVNNALAGCTAAGNRAPTAGALSFNADASTPYVEKQLIGSDPDNDTITYELIGD